VLRNFDAGGNPQHEELKIEPSEPEGLGGDAPDEPPTANVTEPSRQLTHCFLRLANLDNAAFDRLACHETRLWRQIVQTMSALEPL
jgi:hypothetical protein